MIGRVKSDRLLGAKLFRAFVVVLGCLWIWHSFFSGVGEVGQSQNLSEQGRYAAEREKALAEKAKAEACSARMKAYIDNTPMMSLLDGNDALERECDPNYAFNKMSKGCRAMFEEWKSRPGHAAFAVSAEGGCGRSWKTAGIDAARQLAVPGMQQRPT